MCQRVHHRIFLLLSSPLAPGSVTVWSGLDGTGTELADITLVTTPESGTGCNTAFCPWVASGVTFSGTAESVVFSGAADQIGFSAVTLGSVTPVIPEPSTWVIMVIGFASLGFAGYQAKRKNIALVA
jgi:hypothetical protein